MNEREDVLVLSDDRIIETVSVLHNRICDRFPDSGLSKLCHQLHNVARQAAQRSAWISRPIRWIRFLSFVLTILLVAFLAGSVYYAVQNFEEEKVGFTELVQTLESVLNEIIFFAIAIFFLFSLETRIKRSRALAAVHELRSIAHIIDMHQLTKDPERTLRSFSGARHSPKQSLTPMQLNRYLDYCSEMLSLTGKIAALYVQHFDDASAVAAVSEVEQLSTGLSRKIWQKIIATRMISAEADRSGDGEPVRQIFGPEETSGQTPGDDKSPAIELEAIELKATEPPAGE